MKKIIAILCYSSFICVLFSYNISLKVNPTELYIKYKEWCDRNSANVLTVNVFGMRLTERGLGTKQAGGKRYRLGVGLSEKSTASTT
jgi:hypothetical protein